MKKLKLDLLSKEDAGQLKGGFAVVEGESSSETSATNTNCAKDSGWWSNGNCGCNACGKTHISK